MIVTAVDKRACIILLGFLAIIPLFLSVAVPATAIEVAVSINTPGLSGTQGALAFDLVSPDAAQNNAIISGFTSDGTLGTPQFFGAPAFGFLPGNVNLLDTDFFTNENVFFNELLQGFTFGTSIQFNVTLSENHTPSSPPDQFAFFLLDPTGTSSLVQTTDPTGADALFVIEVGSATLTVYEPVGASPPATWTVEELVVPIHDLAVTKITAPKVASAASPVTKSVKVQIQNRSPHDETVEAFHLGDGVFFGLVLLSVTVVDDDGEGCSPATVALDTDKNSKTFTKGPKVLKPKAKLTVYYLVTYDCTAALPKDSTDLSPGDYSHFASVHHEALDGNFDSHSPDDFCPRSVIPPFEVDPNPDGTIKDKGCGAKKADKTFGDPVVTDVVSP